MPISLTRAQKKDDALLRRLLRENAMPSWVNLALTREPIFFGALSKHLCEFAVIAQEDDLPIGMYTGATHTVYLNGMPQEIGYLGALRVIASHQNRVSILKKGYASIAQFSDHKLWYTSIASENTRARRVLEAGVRGLPSYIQAGELASLLVPASRAKTHGLWQTITENDLPLWGVFYEKHAKEGLLAPCLTLQALRFFQSLGARFFWVKNPRTNEVSAVCALWETSSQKQVLVTSYLPLLSWMRPFYNVWASLTKRVLLPKPQENLPYETLSFFMRDKIWQGREAYLLEDILRFTKQASLSFGIDAKSPALLRLKVRFAPLMYRTQFYWVPLEGKAPSAGHQTLQPELSFL